MTNPFVNNDAGQPPSMEEQIREAIADLMELAKTDCGAGKRAAGVLLSLWNDSFGVNMGCLNYLDGKYARAARVLMGAVTRPIGFYLWNYLTEAEMRPVMRLWGNTWKLDGVEYDYSEVE